MKGIKPTSYLNNMITYTNPQPARRKGSDCCLPGLLPGQPSSTTGPGGARVPCPWGARPCLPLCLCTGFKVPVPVCHAWSEELSFLSAVGWGATPAVCLPC